MINRIDSFEKDFGKNFSRRGAVVVAIWIGLAALGIGGPVIFAGWVIVKLLGHFGVI